MASDAAENTLQVELITPEKKLFSGPATMIEVPGTLGDFGVLPGHAPFVSTIRPGIITIELPGNEKRKIAVLSGIAEVVPERCTVLSDTAVDCTGISATEAQGKVQAARKALDDAITDEAKKTAEDNLAIAEAIASGAA